MLEVMLKKIIRPLILVLLFALSPPAYSITLQEKFNTAKNGDFIVTSQQGHTSLLFIRSISNEVLILEEISIPEDLIDPKAIKWQEWLDQKAPGHTSWTLYEIDRKTGALIECFSLSKKGWLYLSRSEQFFAQLLSLPLSEVPREQRKKIGPAPGSFEEDRRALWSPPVVLNGKKIGKPSLEVWKARWPEDKSLLSLCEIELYFFKNSSALSFPYWVEIKSPHYTFKIRSLDSGRDLRSPFEGGMPHRPPRFRGLSHKAETAWEIPVQAPLYNQKLRLFALSEENGVRSTTPLAFTLKPTEDQEHFFLHVEIAELRKQLQPGQRYQWVLTSDGNADFYITSDEIFGLL